MSHGIIRHRRQHWKIQRCIHESSFYDGCAGLRFSMYIIFCRGRPFLPSNCKFHDANYLYISRWQKIFQCKLIFPWIGRRRSRWNRYTSNLLRFIFRHVRFSNFHGALCLWECSSKDISFVGSWRGWTRVTLYSKCNFSSRAKIPSRYIKKGFIARKFDDLLRTKVEKKKT